jgi:hypothetical protein
MVRAEPHGDVRGLLETVGRLTLMIDAITAEEFRWQDTHYDRDSVLGRELLFLIAHDEWAIASTEKVSIARSDTVGTTIEIDVDLDRITHHAFRGRSGFLWLPVLVLPPSLTHGEPRRGSWHDAFATKVVDANGTPLVTLSNVDVQHRISAALSDILVDLAIGLTFSTESRDIVGTRDQRLLLSAAIYRLLRGEHVAPSDAALDEPVYRAPTRANIAGRQLAALLQLYITRRDTSDTNSTAESAEASRFFAPLVARRAVQVLQGFISSAIVVVATECRHMPTVLTITVPNRALYIGSAPQALTRPHTWRRLMPGSWILPRAHLQVDLLMPSADADRQVQVTLDGVAFDPSRPSSTGTDLMEIVSGQPQPMHQLTQLMHQLISMPSDWPDAVYQSLADLAGAKADTARDSLREYEVAAEPVPSDSTVHWPAERTSALRRHLDTLSKELASISADSSTVSSRGQLAATWAGGNWLKVPLRRRTSTERVSPDIAVARARMIEDSSQRAEPTRARIGVYIAVTDSEYITAMSSWGLMTSVLMAVVLIFFVSEKVVGFRSQQISPDVLIFVLGLSSAIQAGRIGRPDLNTIRGLLVRGGELLTVALILPTAVLAIGLAFSSTTSSAITWAAGCLGLELLIQGLLRMRFRSEFFHPNNPQTQNGLFLGTDPLDYSHAKLLHSSWWSTITADALTAGRPAYGYVTWQRGGSPTPALRKKPTDILAMQHWGLGEQSLTFAVFRDRPEIDGDAADGDLVEIDLDLGRVRLGHQFVDAVDIFLGLGHSLVPVTGHPITAVLRAAALRQLTVLGTQFPVPPVAAMQVGLQWARVQIGLRDGDIGRLALMLNDMSQLTTPPSSDRQGFPSVLGIRTDARGFLRILNPPPTIAGPTWATAGEFAAPARILLASDLDVAAASGVDQVESATAATWRLMAIGAERLVDAESAILGSLAPGLRLARLTTATVQGKSMVLLLGHQPGGRNAEDKSLGKASGNRDDVIVYLDKWQTRRDIGVEPHSPLLLVHIGTLNESAMTLEMLEALRETLNCMTLSWPESEQGRGWYPRMASVANDVTVAQFTCHLAGDPATPFLDSHQSWWGQAEFSKIARRTLALTASKMPTASSADRDRGLDLNVPENPAISIEFAMMPQPNLQVNLPHTSRTRD